MAAYGRVIIAHTFAHMRDAFAAAQDVQAALVLQTATGALRFAGAQYLLTMYEKAHALYPQVEAKLVLNCDDAGAETVSAMRVGHKYLRSDAPEGLKAKLVDIAGQLGVVMVEGEYAALDLRYTYDVSDACKKWLVALE